MAMSEFTSGQKIREFRILLNTPCTSHFSLAVY